MESGKEMFVGAMEYRFGPTELSMKAIGKTAKPTDQVTLISLRQVCSRGR